MKIPNLPSQAQSALILSVIKTHLFTLGKEYLAWDILGARLKDWKCILLISSPIAKTEVSFILRDLQEVLLTRGFLYTLQLRLSTWNT